MEFVLKSAFETVMGKSSCPDVRLCKRFQEAWSFTDQTNYQESQTDEDVRKFISPVMSKIIVDANEMLCLQHPRDDYCELHELTIIFLGFSCLLVSKKYTFIARGFPSCSLDVSKAMYSSEFQSHMWYPPQN